MELESRNLFIDTQYLFSKGFNFESNEITSLIDLAAKGSIQVFMTDITNLEIVKKIKEQVQLAFFKINNSDSRILKSLPLYRKFLAVYSEEKSINALVSQYELFKTKCRITIISSGGIKFMQVFHDYVNEKPPFNSSSGKNRKAEFPDAFALATIKNWVKTNNTKAYLLSGDSDWQQFADNRHFFHLNELTAFIDILIRHEASLQDMTSFADQLIGIKKDKIEKHILQALKNRTYIGFASKREVEIQEHYIIAAQLSEKDILSVGRDGAIYQMQFLVTAVFKYWMLNFIFHGEERLFKGLEQEIVFLKHEFTISVDMTFSFKDAIPGSFKIVRDQAPATIEVAFEDGQALSLDDWALTLPVIVCGVSSGKLTENGTGSQHFHSFDEAVKVFPDLDIYHAGKRFTRALGNKISDDLRFETWKANDLYSS
ncbi:hypothetical protein DYU05_19510 [Mucilaginibacter terrenus]|uniref:DUF4935 domain-containing protein n=1 Tax=Mucilaginibacter terrenus TaxID=2482727 RepID=A0A3E2NKF7_9SPHI|nr:PIN domain-containing protein [Mucilaginibacter terrenus]RFZ81468.1 hypothetical protein DYU05_19510 [Mucilaginibacter terrenus]